MAPMTGLSELEEAMLREARVPQDIGTGYGVIREIWPLLTPAEQHARLSSVLLSLIDKGLLVLFRATLEEGYSADATDVTALTEREVREDLELGPDLVPARDAMLFFVITDAGRQILGISNA